MINNLYEKYQVTQYPVDDPINPLSYILRKAELAKKLTSSEWLWLEHGGFHSTIAIIKIQEDYRNLITNEIKSELQNLIEKWKKYFPDYSLGISSTMYTETGFLLYRMNRFEDISDCTNDYVKHIFKPIYETYKLKTSLSITEDIPINTNTYQKLFSMSISGYRLNSADLTWLIEFKVHSAIDFLSTSISDIFNEFSLTLQATETNNILYISLILQKLKENIDLSQHEFQFLQKRKMTNALVVAEKLELSQFKKKFKATSFTDDSPNSHLYKVLKKLDAGLALPEPDINFLKKWKLNDTLKIVYKPEADKLIHKLNSGHELRPDDIAWCKEHGFEEIIFLWLINDVDVKRRFDQPDSKFFTILQKLKHGNRLIDDEIVWLESEKLFQHSTPIFKTHHRLEAEFSEAEFSRTKGYWNLVNASAHWRKAENPARALEKTEKLDLKSIKPAKLTAALLTTRGGALRDVNRLEEAEECALEAIKHYSDSYNPYTLMGALCYGTGRYEEGRRWFEEAIKRGATEQDEDVEIKRILRKKEDHNNLIEYLLKRDPHRFAWVKKFQQNSHKAVLLR